MDAKDSSYEDTSTSVEPAGAEAETLHHHGGAVNNQQEKNDRGITSTSRMLLTSAIRELGPPNLSCQYGPGRSRASGADNTVKF